MIAILNPGWYAVDRLVIDRVVTSKADRAEVEYFLNTPKWRVKDRWPVFGRFRYLYECDRGYIMSASPLPLKG